MFSINHIVCTNSVGTVSHSYQGMVETLPKSKLPDTSQEPALQLCLSKDSSLRPTTLTHFCTQALCTGYFLCLEHFSPRSPHALFPHILQMVFKYHLISGLPQPSYIKQHFLCHSHFPYHALFSY